MNKKLSKILSCGVCLTMAAVFTAGCKPAATNADTRPFVMAIGATDGVFSPFFATAQYDTQVAELTQISMLASDEKGNITCGENEPTVVLDYTETMYDADGNVSESGDIEGKTVYEFVIKKGIKYSDGVELTIKDVLFNLYVYLDPAYFGSSTIYSTDIKGLAAYRNQIEGLSDDAEDQNSFDTDAQSRINYLMDYLKDPAKYSGPISTDDLDADIVTLQKLYKEEVTSDWTSCYGTLDSYKEEYTFTTNWEVYYFTEGLISQIYDLQEDGNRVARKDSNGKYVTSLDEDRQDLRTEMKNALANESNIKKAMDTYGCTREEALEYVERDTAINTVYRTKAESGFTELRKIFTEGWATASELRDKFAKEAMTAYYDEIRKTQGGLIVKNISGIKAIKSNDSVAYKGKYADHDILQITINGVDPKAIWNFAFQVAPAHYYSGTYKGTDYTKIDIANNQFGVCFGDSTFFDTVLNATKKSKCPVGAGAYQASTANGGTTIDGDKFHNNKVTYYMRNDNFTTVGSGISNAKIKYVRYREVDSSSMLTVLKSGEVDYGDPSCTPSNIASLSGLTNLASQTPIASGYGYVGINPKFVPDYEVRVAIMRAMNIMRTVGYYTTQYASPIYRPMSKANWVYEEYLTDINDDYYPYVGDIDPTTNDYSASEELRDYLKGNGWNFGDKDEKVGEKDGRTLKYTFTIAGGTEDHPAFGMFKNAQEILNHAGFEITVMTSTDALKQLATGSLAVWAAAYTSPVDPDLYQVYHKDSKATSVKNWGYADIKSNTGGLYTDELSILNYLSDLIIEARESIAHTDRGPKYREALDLIMDLAIQLPTYQRQDLIVYNRDLLDTNTLNKKATAYAGVLNRIWELNYNS